MSFVSMLRFVVLSLSLVSVLPADARDAAQGAETDAPRILALGDSMMAWHMATDRSIPDILAKALREPVENRAIGGARVIYNLPVSGAMGLKISKQYRGDDVDWVVLNGGGNDLWLGCGCGKCDRKMARMVSQNGRSGEIPKLVDQIRARGARVIYLGYLRSPGVESIIDPCAELGDEFEARIGQMVSQREGVFFLNLSDLVPEGDRSFHTVGMLHPSRKASNIIGQKVAEIIRQMDDTR